MCLDVALQEQRLTVPLELPDPRSFPAPTPLAAQFDVIARAARMLLDARQPLVMLGHADGAWDDVVALAECLGAAVVTDRSPASFPTDHPLHQGNQRGQSQDGYAEAVREADVVLAINKIDVAGSLGPRDGAPVRLVNVTLEPYAARSWAADFQALPKADLVIASNAALAVRALRDAVERAMRDSAEGRRRVEDRARSLGERSRARRAQHAAANAKRRRERPIHLARALASLREAFGARAADVIVAQAPLAPWPAATWDYTKPKSFLGHDGGGGVGSGPGIAVGAALAARGSGRPVVAVIGDGELLAAPTALWTAAHHHIPVLFVIANNRSYYNDEEHQEHVARVRSRPVENRWVGQRLDDPPVDFASLARDLGAEGIGPVEDPEQLAPTFARAVKALDEGRPVLVDVRVAPR